MAGLFVSTTGTDVDIPELGIIIVHPTTDRDMGDQFNPEEIRGANSLTTAIVAGTLVWKKSAGGATETPSNYDKDYLDIEQENTGTGATADRAATFKDLALIDFRAVTNEPTGFLNQTDSIFSYVDTTRTFTIQPKSPATSYDYYIKGVKYTESASKSVVNANTEGLWYFYFTGTTLECGQSYKTYASGSAMIAIMYWDSGQSVACCLFEERHGIVMDGDTHGELHNTIGTQLVPGGLDFGNYTLQGDGSSDPHAQVSISNGTIYDEDIRCNIVNAATPANRFEQILSTVAKIPIMYKAGTASAPTIEMVDATNFPCIWTSGQRLKYNQLNGSNNWVLTEATEGYIVTVFIYASTEIRHPIMAILGQGQDPSATQANMTRTVALTDMLGLPMVETVLLGRLFFQTSSAYSNQPKARLLAIDSVDLNNNTAEGLTNYNLTSNTAFVTASTTDVAITSFSITPAAGTYVVLFDASSSATQNNASVFCSIYKNGSAVTDSARPVQSVSANFVFGQHTQSIIQVSGTEAIDVRVKISQGSLTVNGRSLLLMRLGN